MERIQRSPGEVAEAAASRMDGPHTRMVYKTLNGHLGSKQSQCLARPCSPVFQRWENKASSLLAVETSGSWGSGVNYQSLRTVPLKGPNGP